MKNTTKPALGNLKHCMISLMVATSGAVVAEPVESPKPRSKSSVEEVVVTARRSEESLQTTPIAVTALTADAIEDLRIQDIDGIQYIAPNLVISRSHSGSSISLRGQVQGNSDSSADQSVGLYLDGVYVARQIGAISDLIDVERIEVLHGPQGTLFGRNTTGGALNVIHNKPAREFGANIELGVGNYNQQQAAMMVNVPVVDNQLSVRLAGKMSKHDGYGDNVFLNRDVGDKDNLALRFSALYEPESNWSLLLTADYMDMQNNGPTTNLLTAFDSSLPPGVDISPYINTPYHKTQSELETFEEVTAWGTSATLTVDINGLEFKSISAYRNLDNSTFTDFDNTPLPLFDNGTQADIDQFTQEFQLTGTSGDLDWITGLYYFVEDGNERFTPLKGLVNLYGEFEHTSYAAFVQGNYAINDKLRITAGLRYTDDKRELRANNVIAGGCAIAPALVQDPVNCIADTDVSFDYLSHTLSADYQLSDSVFLYARTSVGRKSGGISKTIGTLTQFDPEKITDYEVGFKSDFFDKKLRVNASAFLAFYENMQRPITKVDDNGNPVSFTDSVGEAEIPGIELQLVAVPFDGFELTANVGLIDPEYKEFTDATGDRSDEPFTHVSKKTWNLAATYTKDVSFGYYKLHADYGYQSEKYYFPNERAREPGYGLLGANATVHFEQNDIDLTVWGKNLTDEDYNGYILDFSARGYVTGYPGAPKTYGVSVQKYF